MSERVQPNSPLTEAEMQQFMKTVGDAAMHVLKTGQNIIVSFPSFDLALMIAQEEFSLQSSVHILSKSSVSQDKPSQLHMPPLYAGRRHIVEVADFKGYVNEEEVPHLEDKQREALFFMIHLLKNIQFGDQ